MPTFFQTSLLETFRGPEHARAQRDAGDAESPDTRSTEVARDVLQQAGRRTRSTSCCPRSARMLWRLKRWMPLRFSRQASVLRACAAKDEALSTGESTASMKRV